jgi:hypothetical protein
MITRGGGVPDLRVFSHPGPCPFGAGGRTWITGRAAPAGDRSTGIVDSGQWGPQPGGYHKKGLSFAMLRSGCSALGLVDGAGSSGLIVPGAHHYLPGLHN